MAYFGLIDMALMVQLVFFYWDRVNSITRGLENERKIKHENLAKAASGAVQSQKVLRKYIDANRE